MKQKRQELPTDIHLWKWSYKGRHPNGLVATLKGTLEAPNCRMGNIASDIVQREQREKYPDTKWMHGKDVEGEGDWERCTFGPTVQRGKFLREATPEDLEKWPPQ